MNLYWGFGECIKCHDRQGPWVLVEDSKWYCESCHEKYIKDLLSSCRSSVPQKARNNPATARLDKGK